MADKEVTQLTDKPVLDGTEETEIQNSGGGLNSSFKSTINAIYNYTCIKIGTFGTGIKIGRASPTFGFRDVIGQMYPDISGGDAPSLSIWRGLNRRYAFGVNDRMATEIHVPHDIVNADMFGHFHFGHNGAACTGSLELAVSVDHTKGHKQAGGGNYVLPNLIIDCSTLTQYQSDITDVPFANSGGTGGYLDFNDIEPDDSLNIEMKVVGIPTITGGTSSSPFIWNADIHAQTTGILGTKNKSPSFYV